MQKTTILLNIAVIAALLMTSACRRNFTCICVYPNSSISTSKTTYKTYKRSDAEAECSKLNNAVRINGGSCALE